MVTAGRQACVRRPSSVFPWWLQVTHFINVLFLGLLIRSGWESLSSHPRLYWNNDCGPGSEWLKFTKDKVVPLPAPWRRGLVN